jgi:4-amino-4-deoxy-L-arabinose transferase-like glycosyltransferase
LKARSTGTGGAAPNNNDGPTGRFAGSWLMLPILAALLYLGLSIHAAYLETPTVDEFAHVPAGYAYLSHGRLDLYAKNPPLLKYWMALPIVVNSRVTTPEVAVEPHAWGPWQYGLAFMNANRHVYLNVFFHARLMVIIVGLATGFLLLGWARELYGSHVSAVVSALFFLSPTVLAHSHLATIDSGCMFSMFLAVFTLRWAYRRPAWPRLVAAGAALGLAMLVKFTAVLLILVFIGLAVVYRGADGPLRKRRGLLQLMRDLVLQFVPAVVMINLLMGFKGTFKPVGEYSFVSSFCESVQRVIPDACPVPLPEDYVVGFDAQKRDAEKGEAGSYLMGRWSQEGWWYYNFLAFGLKVSLPLLVLLLLSPWCLFRQGLPGKELWAVLLPVVVFLVLTSAFNRLNIGIRYILPIFPFLFLLAGSVLRQASLAASKWWRRLIRALVLVYCGVTVALVHPSYLSFFNVLAGGPERGPQWLLDSNLDWGQDLYRVRGAAERLKGGETIRLLYFGHVDPSIYGLKYAVAPDRPVKDVVAVSVNYLKGLPYPLLLPDGKVVFIGPDHLNWLRGKQPVENLGSILVFDTRDRE